MGWAVDAVKDEQLEDALRASNFGFTCEVSSPAIWSKVESMGSIYGLQVEGK
jgi:hypothetical protein